MAVLAAVLAGCASAALHFHTLVPAPVDAASAPVVAHEGIEISAVRVPAAADRLELVVRRNESDASILNQELWVAPLGEELRSALELELRRQLSSELSGARGPPTRTAIRLDVQRFEGMPSHYALIDAGWRLSVAAPAGNIVIECVDHVVEPVGAGYPALVRGYQRAVIVIADRIAAAAREAQVDSAPRCAPPPRVLR